MKAALILNCDNAAFGDIREEVALETAAIIHGIAVKLRANSDYGRTWETLRDANGNDVGRFCLKAEEDPGCADLRTQFGRAWK